MPIFIATKALAKQQNYDRSSTVDGLSLRCYMAPVAITSEQTLVLLKVLSEPIRLQLVQCLSSGERCVCELTSELGLGQSKLSFHLKVMKGAGLINSRQQGRWIYYRLAPESLILLSNWIGQLAASCLSSAVLCN
jgi:ArsR family transcriptional regulator